MRRWNGVNERFPIGSMGSKFDVAHQLDAAPTKLNAATPLLKAA
jgi:hypothetical protein